FGCFLFFFSSRRRHTRSKRDWSSDVCSSDLIGLVIGGKEYSVWYNELGMQIAVGHTVHDRILDKTFLSWEDVSGRIQQLLKQGEYAPQSVLDAARDNALKEHAQTLLYMERDLAEGVAELVFADTEPFRG